MNFDISNVVPSQATSAATPRTGPAQPARAPEGTDAVILDMIPPVPPAEVLQQIALAADSYDKLLQSGVHLHFETDPQTGKLSVQVQDVRGNVIGTVPAAKVLDLASGGTLG
jgi:hypothetical protein